jgi:hypothetical protein
MALSKSILKWLEPVQPLLPKFSPCPVNSLDKGRWQVVHEFTMGDVDDPDIYAAEPLWQFQQSEKGQWVIEHSLETPVYQRVIDQMYYGYKYKISARLTEQDITYFLLKWH